VFALLRGGGVATNGWPGARNGPWAAREGGGSWCPRVHSGERTLREYYQHITREEHRAAISVPFVWPTEAV